MKHIRKPLYEQYRPIELAQIVGQDKAIQKLQAIEARTGYEGQAIWISGQSGTGKTTIARIIATSVADPLCVHEIDSQDCTPAYLRDLESDMQCYGYGEGGKAYIVNESHGLRKDSIRQLLVLLERIPTHVVIIFTTTNEGQDKLFEDSIEESPLLSRCKVIQLSRQGLADSFATRAREIAQAEGLDGQPEKAYKRLAQECRNNFRMMLQRIEAGEFVGVKQ